MTVEQITFWALVKNGSYLLAFVASVQYFGFHPEALFIYTILMLLDLATGVIRIAKVESGKAVTSTKARDGLMKKALLLVALFTIGLTGKGVGFDTSILLQASVNVLILSEAYSILGNIHSTFTGRPKDEYDAVSFILGRLRDMLPEEKN